jgi:uncharacterized membrane protein
MICMGMYAAPVFSRRGILFGVTVDPAFRLSGEARHIVSRYRLSVIAVLALSIGALWIASPHLTGLQWPIATVLLVLFQFLACVACMAAANKRTQTLAGQQPSERTASLQPRTSRRPGGWVLLIGPMLIVICGGIVLLANRNSIPSATFRGAMSLMLVASFAGVCLTGVACLGALRTRQIGRNDRLGMRYFPLVGMAYVFTAFSVHGALAFTNLLSPVSRITLDGVLLITLIALIFVIIYQVRALSNLAAVDNTPDECWKWGLFYCNPDDPAFLVEKRIGFGWTLNYANKSSWVVTFCLVAVPILIRLVWF